MGRIDATARGLARQQRGLLRAADLRDAGVSSSTISRRLRADEWAEPYPGVLDITGAPMNWKRAVAAAVLYGPPETVASHRTAAALHGVLGFKEPEPVEVTVPRRARSRDVPITVHSTIHPCSPGIVDFIPVAPLSRTALDLATSTSDKLLARVVRKALRDGDLLDRLVDDEWFVRARGAARLRTMARREWAHSQQDTDSPLEELGVEQLRGRVPPFVTQHAISVGGRHARFDIAWPDQKVALELDGDGAHGDHLAVKRDGQRTADVERDGWIVLRATWSDLRGDAFEALVQRIHAALAAR